MYKTWQGGRGKVGIFPVGPRTDGTWQPNQYRSRILDSEDDGDEMAVPGMFAAFDSEGNRYGSPDVTILSIIWDMPIR